MRLQHVIIDFQTCLIFIRLLGRWTRIQLVTMDGVIRK